MFCHPDYSLDGIFNKPQYSDKNRIQVGQKVNRELVNLRLPALVAASLAAKHVQRKRATPFDMLLNPALSRAQSREHFCQQLTITKHYVLAATIIFYIVDQANTSGQELPATNK